MTVYAEEFERAYDVMVAWLIEQPELLGPNVIHRAALVGITAGVAEPRRRLTVSRDLFRIPGASALLTIPAW